MLENLCPECGCPLEAHQPMCIIMVADGVPCGCTYGKESGLTPRAADEAPHSWRFAANANLSELPCITRTAKGKENES